MKTDIDKLKTLALDFSNDPKHSREARSRYVKTGRYQSLYDAYENQVIAK